MLKQLQLFKSPILRFPRLDTILMIEDTIKKSRGDLTVTVIWKKIPKKVMWQTYLTALDYLEYSGKIYIEKDRHVIWIWAPQKIKELKERGLVIG